MCSTGGVAPQVDQGCFPKPLLSPEERDPEHSMKSLFFSSKEVSFDLYEIVLELCNVYVNKLKILELFILRCVLLLQV